MMIVGRNGGRTNHATFGLEPRFGALSRGREGHILVFIIIIAVSSVVVDDGIWCKDIGGWVDVGRRK